MTADMLAPLLRAPPFPGIAAATAAVTDAATPVDAPIGDAAADAAFEAFRVARVGGAFWGEQASEPATAIDRSTVPTSRDAIDPWSMLAPGVTLTAHGDDAWVAVAEAAGADVELLSSGRFGRLGDDGAARRRRIGVHLLHSRYRDPFSGEAATLAETLALLELWRDQIGANRRIAAAAGMAWWKRAEIRRFLWAPRRRPLRFVAAAPAIARAARRCSDLAVWPSRVPPETFAAAAERGVGIVQIEDGFIRSIGLGVELVPPLSIVADRIGIHYDPTAPSALEQMLEAGGFAPALLARAAALGARIVAARIGKYGGVAETNMPARTPGRRLVLVPGQVEDDRSVLLGGGAVAGNLDLLRRVRAAEPDAEIWFRPHPDVDTGHRRGSVANDEALRHVDRVVRGGSMAALLDAVDAVHVLTSLTGFEALLRGREVLCHGMPFFAGWGLTRDLAPTPTRRTRRVSLDELVAATLIRYPRYLDPVTRLPCPPEVLVTRFAERPTAAPTALTRLRRLQALLPRRR